MTTTGTTDTQREILYLSYDGLTDALGESQILPYLLGLARDFRITVITFEKPARFVMNGAESQRMCDEAGVHWIPLRYHKFPPVISALYDLLILRSMVKRLLSGKRISAIHCRSYLTALVGLWAKRRFAVKFIFDMRGFWADERVDGGLWDRRNPLYRLIYTFFKRKEKQFFSESDHIISLTENARTEIQSWGLTETPITVIPTCVDLAHFMPPAQHVRESLRAGLGISPDDFALVYLGSWGTWYLTVEMLDFFSVLDSIVGGAKLLVLTPDHPDISGYHLASKVIVRRASRKDVPGYLSIGHAAVCFIKPSYSKKASSATKIAESWAMNLPVVVNSGWGDIDELLDSGFPLIVCNSPADYRDAALSLVRTKQEDSRKMLIGKFDLESGIRRYKAVYESLDL